MIPSFPGVTHIYAIHISALPADIRRAAEVNIPVIVIDSPLEIGFYGKAVLTAERKDGKTSSKLTFNTTERIPADRLGFAIRTVGGRQYIIGAAEPPFVRISVEASTGETPTDTRGLAYTVEFDGLPARCANIFR